MAAKTALIFGREPAVWVATLSAGLQALTAFGIDVSSAWQSVITALVSALLGLAVAVMVGDGVLPAVLGLAQAVLSLVVGLGLDWSAADQAKVMTFLTVGLGLIVRSQVTAPVTAGHIAGPVVLKSVPPAE